MTQENKHCTMCGKPFDEWDTQENFGLDYWCGYGSIHDNEHIKMNLCCSCFDKLMDKVIPLCKRNPFENETYDYLGMRLNKANRDRLNRIFTVLGKNKMDRINKTICDSFDVPSYLDLVEKELVEDGYDLDSVPVEHGAFYQRVIESLKKSLAKDTEQVELKNHKKDNL